MSRIVAATFAVATADATQESGITTIITQLPSASSREAPSTASATDSLSSTPGAITSAPTASRTTDVLLSLAKSLLSGYESSSLRPIPSAIVVNSLTYIVKSGSIITPPPTISSSPASTIKSSPTLAHASPSSTPSSSTSSQMDDMEASIVIGIAIGGLALAVLGLVGFCTYRRKKKTGTYLRPTSRPAEKDPEMWQALRHESTAVTSPVTLADEWADSYASPLNHGYVRRESARERLLIPPTPLNSAHFAITRPEHGRSLGGSEGTQLITVEDASVRRNLHHELDSRPLPPIPIERARSPQELQGDVAYPSELSPYGRSSLTVEYENVPDSHRPLQPHHPISWTSLMRPQRFSRPPTLKRQHSGALDAVKPLQMMGFGGGNRREMPTRPLCHQPRSCNSPRKSDLSSAPAPLSSSTLARQVSRCASELNTTRSQRSVAFEQVQERALARRPSQRTLSSFPSGQTIRLVEPESPPESKARPPSGPMLSQARYEPPEAKVRRSPSASGWKRPQPDPLLGQGETPSPKPRRTSGLILLPTRYEPPTRKKQPRIRRSSEVDSPKPTQKYPGRTTSDCSYNRDQLSSPVVLLSHPTDIGRQETVKAALNSPVQPETSAETDYVAPLKVGQQRIRSNQFAAPSDSSFFGQIETPSLCDSRDMERNPVSPIASFKGTQIPEHQQGLYQAYQQSLPPWTQPFSPHLDSTSGSPSERRATRPRPRGPFRSGSARSVHYPSWSEISEFDFTGDGSTPVRFLRPLRNFGQVVSTKVKQIEERVELIGSLPAGHGSGSLHSGSNPGTPRSAHSPGYAL